MIAILCVTLTLLAVPTHEQDPQKTPCPGVLMYEPKSEPGRWYANVYLTSENTLHTLWLDVVLDRKADLIGTSVGPVYTLDNIDFRIENAEITIAPGAILKVDFFAKFNPLFQPPSVQIIRLNGKEICNVNNPQDPPDVPQEVQQTDIRTSSLPYSVISPSEILQKRPVKQQPPESFRPVYVVPVNQAPSSLHQDPSRTTNNDDLGESQPTRFTRPSNSPLSNPPSTPVWNTANYGSNNRPASNTANYDYNNLPASNTANYDSNNRPASNTANYDSNNRPASNIANYGSNNRYGQSIGGVNLYNDKKNVLIFVSNTE